MKFRVEFANQAKADLFEIYTWIADNSAVNAARWVMTLESAIHGLDAVPERCSVAPEDEVVDEFEVRHLIVGRYRVVFIMRERRVIVLHIRHGSRRPATREEIARAIREGAELEPG